MAEESFHTPKDNKKTFNSGIYHDVIKRVVDNDDDYFWLANRLAGLYRKVQSHGCVDSTRACKVREDGLWDDVFEEAITCCGQSNVRLTNPKTQNTFWIGFNYGH